ncbi:MAG: response regulator transcription factor [Bacteroidetes bacterium]|nr:response regulator transcription factor [Bacteroidota bacterium]
MKQITIAVVDDHDLFREGIRLVLGQIENFNVIFDTSNGLSFLEFLKNSIPDVVLMDINMPLIDGVETTRQAMELQPKLNVIALTMFSDTAHYTQMINAGIKGFVLKKSNKFELQNAINTVYSGGNYFSQEILQKMAFQYVNFSSKSNRLTPREMDVLQLVCLGSTSLEISDKLYISIKTVEVHRTNIFHKSEVRNIGELIVWAIRNNYFSIE